jgi:type I restriction-modification system DNA methylase subunit
MPAPQKIIDLIERFTENCHAYMSTAYNETQVRRELIDPFFKALGWDIDNEANYAEGYKDVVHEDAIKVGGATRAPDYAFRIGGTRKFFVEAKRPGVNIKEDTEAAYQLRRYAWSAKLSLSIVTDFEKLAVYDCRIKPNKNDKASVARVMYITYNEYPDKWEEISSIFSPEAIRKGSFDKYAQSKRKKRGTAEVDDAFLKEIENWRDILARNIALRNTDLSTRELNYAVQRTIDRIIFLRICEDRGIEKYAQLMSLQNGVNVYQRLCQIFRRADERYNSGLFHFQKEKDRTDSPDELSLNLKIDDKVLKGILNDLYYPESPYEFSVLPADILGHIYEQFLGKVIRLTPAHFAKVEDKPEVKKAGGVYYTPTYIVNYIVEHTVGKLLKRKTPTKVSKLRILDPACGSGSFLLGAYQTLLDWHLQWYQKHDPEKHAKGSKPKIYRGPGGDWRLTTSEKKRILLNNIYGVDIDPQAVEVTKLSLLLKVLEGENEETLVKHLRLFHERALPDLGENIKCGNSLIGPDFYEGKQLSLIDEEERYRINAFDWNAEFPEIMDNGGFDAVIGNPPYGSDLIETSEYLRGEYQVAEYQLESYQLFMERGIQLLNQPGYLGFIIPNPWLTNVLMKKVRQYVTCSTLVLEVVHYASSVFPRVTVNTEVVVLQKPKDAERNRSHEVAISVVRENGLVEQHTINQATWISTPERPFNIFLRQEDVDIMEKMEIHSWLLQELCKISVGIKPYQAGKGRPRQTARTVRERPYDADHKLDDTYKPLLRGADFYRYLKQWPGDRWISYGEWLAEPRPSARFDAVEKLVVRQTSDHLVATLDDEQFLAMNNCHVLVPIKNEPDIRYILGVFNSKLMNHYYQLLNPERGEALAEVKATNLKRLPIRRIEVADSAEQTVPERIVELVGEILSLHKTIQSAKTEHEKSILQRQIDATDKQIDQLVYELYGLTDEEIRIVEEVTK